ncbi:MAG: ribonuclease H family protein [Clostridia bacterium]|nr:ribonuclease H family protein [Clostridia bacterium]
MGKKDRPKFYAVKDEGGGTIYTTWAECEKAVSGRNVKYKSFLTRGEAQAFLEGRDYVFDNKITPLLNEGWAVAFTDGSFDKDWRVYSYGVCIYTKVDGAPTELKGTGQREEYVQSHNIAGEIQGVTNAVRWAEKNGFPKIFIFHDYEGVGKWADGEWEPKNKIAKGYAEFIETKRKTMSIRFMWVKGHASIVHNERADALARRAIEEFRAEKEGGDDPQTRVAWAREEDVLKALSELSADYPSVRYSEDSEKGTYEVTFGENVIFVTFDPKGITVRGNKEEFLHMMFTSYVRRVTEKRFRDADRERKAREKKEEE